MDHKTKNRAILLMGIMMIASMMAFTVSAEVQIEGYFGSTDHCNDTENYQFISDSLNVTDAIRLDGVEAIDPDYDDFEVEWVEQYGGSLTTPTGTILKWSGVSRSSSLAFVDNNCLYSTDGEFEGSLFFELNVTDIDNTNVGTLFINILSWVTGTSYNSFKDIDVGNVEAYGLQLYAPNEQDTGYGIRPFELMNSVPYYAGAIGLLVDTPYYLNFTKTGTLIEISVYTDSGYTLQKDSTISLTLHADHSNCNDLYMLLGMEYRGTRFTKGEIRNLSSSLATGGYEATGNVTSNAIEAETEITLPLDSFCIKSERPTGTTVEVQFSDDNVTWVDESGVEGWHTVTGDYCCSDLTETFTSDPDEFYYRIRLTGDGATTPTVTEARLWVEGSVETQVWGQSILSLIIGIIFGANKWMK